MKLSVGGVFAVAFVTVLAESCALLSEERTHGRLALANLRAAGVFSQMLGRYCALVLFAAVVMAVAGLVLFKSQPPCRVHTPPTLPDVRETAERQMAGFLADPKTPEAVKKAPRAEVLDLLVSKEYERYESIPPEGEATWRFPASGTALRVHFAALADNLTPVTGTFSTSDGAVSLTNAIGTALEVALPKRITCEAGSEAVVTFRNTGKRALLYRPRRDVELLDAADSFAANALRAYLTLVAALAVAVAFGLMLSSALSKPVALFTAFVGLAAALVAPSAVEQFPNAFDASLGERAGLWIARRVTALTEAFTGASAIGDLATGRAITWNAVFLAIRDDVLFWPLAFLSAAAYFVRRRPH